MSFRRMNIARIKRACTEEDQESDPKQYASDEKDHVGFVQKSNTKFIIARGVGRTPQERSTY